MKILITGATGLVGTRLLEVLMLRGFADLRVLTRDKTKAINTITFPVEFFEWNPEQNYLEIGALENVDIVIHLAGENISDGRWSDEKKNRILNSRIKSTELLIHEIKKLKTPPLKFISASAVGIYGEGTTAVTSTSALGNDFLAEVCKSWENTIFNHDIKEMKTQCIRTGVVLSNKGGALSKMLPAFRLGFAGKLGTGKQFLSWIHIDDLIDQFIFLIENKGHAKIYNGTSPKPVTNKEFTKILGANLKRPTLLPVPAFMLKIIFGEMSDILLKGQRVIPSEFIKEGFLFKYTELSLALDDLLSVDT